jgi:hypothetical protein
MEEKTNVNNNTKRKHSIVNIKNVLSLKFIVNCSSPGPKGLKEIKYIIKPNKTFIDV